MIKKYSISELIFEIKHLLESEYSEVLIEGEITNLTRSSAGHWYFNLSDKTSMISCALFKMDALRNPVIRTLKDGDKVLLTGPISVYNKRGTFQVVGKRIHKAGQGDLKQKYELLKKKLESEGLFDLSFKKNIPANPKKIVIITASGGAALQDFINVMKRRSKNFNLLIIPSVVQGEKAPRELRKALAIAESTKDVEVIVFARGGGSLEDLWAFNDEELVRKIFSCEIPVISAIGHQVDFTLCDYVADQRLETPTSAAEVLTQKQKDLVLKIQSLGQRLRSEFQDLSHSLLSRLDGVKPRQQANLLIEKLKGFDNRLNRANFFNQMPQLAGLYNYEQELDVLQKQIVRAVNRKLEQFTRDNENTMALLSAHNPENILKKGFTLVYDKDALVKSGSDFTERDKDLTLVFHDGKYKIKKVD